MAIYTVGSGGDFSNLSEAAGAIGNNDTLNLLDTAPIVETIDAEFNSLSGITIQSDPNNTSDPVVELGNLSRLRIYGCDGILIKNIVFYGTGYQSRMIDIGYGGSVVIDSCTFWDTDSLSGSTNSTAIRILYKDEATIQNCIFYDLSGKAIYSSSYAPQVVKVLNNTFFNFATISSPGVPRPAIYLEYGTTYIYNNIIDGNNNAESIGIQLSSPDGGDQDYNCINACGQEYEGNAISAPHNIDSTNTPGATDPLFVNAVTYSYDLSVSASSPCIGSGASDIVYVDIPTIDFNGTVRPQGSSWDMGAFEAVTGPMIDVQPISQDVSANTNVTFTVEASGGTAPLTYQWKKNNVNISGATNDTLVLTSVTDTNQGTYTVVVTDDDLNSVTSDDAILTVETVPRIIIQPVEIYGELNKKLTLNVVALADVDVPLTYEWKKNGVVVGTNSTFVIGSFKKADIAVYSVTLTNTYGSDESDPINVKMQSSLNKFEQGGYRSAYSNYVLHANHIADVIVILRSKGLYY